MRIEKEIVLVGGGGHCRSCIDLLEQRAEFRIAGIVDVSEKKGDQVLGYDIFAEDAELPSLVPRFKNFLITIGQIKSAVLRKKSFASICELGGMLPIVVSPLAYVSRYAEIGKGTVILPYAMVGAGAKVGENCIINTQALVEHDAVVGDHCHLATGSIVNGGAQIGDEVFLGSGAVVRELTVIAKKNIIGCGVAVTGNVETAGGVVI